MWGRWTERGKAVPSGGTFLETSGNGVVLSVDAFIHSAVRPADP